MHCMCSSSKEKHCEMDRTFPCSKIFRSHFVVVGVIEKSKCVDANISRGLPVGPHLVRPDVHNRPATCSCTTTRVQTVHELFNCTVQLRAICSNPTRSKNSYPNVQFTASKIVPILFFKKQPPLLFNCRAGAAGALPVHCRFRRRHAGLVNFSLLLFTIGKCNVQLRTGPSKIAALEPAQKFHLQQNKKGRLDVCLKHAFGKVCASSPCSACSSYATSPGEAILISGTNRSFCFSPTTLVYFIPFLLFWPFKFFLTLACTFRCHPDVQRWRDWLLNLARSELLRFRLTAELVRQSCQYWGNGAGSIARRMLRERRPLSVSAHAHWSTSKVLTTCACFPNTPPPPGLCLPHQCPVRGRPAAPVFPHTALCQIDHAAVMFETSHH
ncbi:hypothetical protein T06_12009 [Trichinella sp. T6]|nr:hypothetical protein T06_12009 [Trichinella sp. T6]